MVPASIFLAPAAYLGGVDMVMLGGSCRGEFKLLEGGGRFVIFCEAIRAIYKRKSS